MMPSWPKDKQACTRSLVTKKVETWLELARRIFEDAGIWSCAWLEQRPTSACCVVLCRVGLTVLGCRRVSFVTEYDRRYDR